MSSTSQSTVGPLPSRTISASRGLRRHQIKRVGLFLLAATLAALTVLPLLWMISGAFKGPAEVYTPALIPQKPTLANFRYVFTEAPLLRWMGNSLFVSATVTVVGLFFHSMSAYALARLRFPGREAIFFGIFATFLVSLPVILVPLFILVRELGMINRYSGLIVPSIFHAFGIFLLRQFYLGIPRELEEAALVDGAGYWRIYWQIILPLSRPILAALSVFFFLANWNAFLWPLVTTTDRDLYVVQVGIATFRQQYASSQNYIMAASTVVALPTVMLFFVFQRQLIESIKTSGFK